MGYHQQKGQTPNTRTIISSVFPRTAASGDRHFGVPPYSVMSPTHTHTGTFCSSHPTATLKRQLFNVRHLTSRGSLLKPHRTPLRPLLALKSCSIAAAQAAPSPNLTTGLTDPHLVRAQRRIHPSNPIHTRHISQISGAAMSAIKGD